MSRSKICSLTLSGVALWSLALPLWAETPKNLTPEQLAQQLAIGGEAGHRREALFQLSKVGKEAKVAVPALIQALNDPDRQVWAQAISILANLGPDAEPAIPKLLEQFATKKGGRQRDIRQAMLRASFALSRIGPKALPSLLDGVKSDDPGLRAGCAKALGGMGPAAKEAIPLLVANLRLMGEDERRETIDALGLMGRDAAKPLAEALGSGDANVRSGAALALAQLGKDAQEAAPKVAELAVSEGDNKVRAALFSAVPKVGIEPKRAVELLIPGVTHDQEEVRHAATNALFLLQGGQEFRTAALVKLLKDPYPVWSQRAATVLGRLGSSAEAAVPALLEVGTKQNPPNPVYFEALGQIGPAAVPNVLRAVEKENPDALTRDHWSVKCIQSIGGEAVQPLTVGLSSKNLSVRLLAARGLGELGPAAASASGGLLAAASDPDARIRAAALGSLVSVRAPSDTLVARVDAGLKDPSPIVRATAAQLVPHLGNDAPQVAAPLLAALNDQDENVRISAAQVLGSIGAAAQPAVKTLVDLLPNADAPARVRMLGVLGLLGEPAKPALPQVKSYLENSDPAVRAAALAAYGRLETGDAKLPVIIKALSDGDPKVRQAAAEAVRPVISKAPTAIPPLLTMLAQENERSYAMESLRRANITEVPQIIQMLEIPEYTVRMFACQLVIKLGPAAKDTKTALEKVAQDRQSEAGLKRKAGEALDRIK